MERRRAFNSSTIIWGFAIIFNLLFVIEGGTNPALIQKCKENAAKGAEANPTIISLCAALNIQVQPDEECTPPPPPLSPPSEITDLISVLQEGLKQMDKQRGSSHGEKAVLVLGNTGSGKSTVIIDEEQKIGAPNTNSKTLLPSFAHDSKNNISFWDCPEFDDNRGDDEHTAATFFLKYVLDSTSQVKLLFTIPEDSVQPDGSRTNFDLLASHASRLIKNISKFRLSIGLVVTKVTGHLPNTGELRNDTEILDRIKQFLELYVTHMKRDLAGLTQESKRKPVRNKIIFAEAIHKQGKTGNKGNLFFIRSPKMCGVPEKTESVVYTREKLQSLLRNLRFTRVTPNDFMYTLKDSTLNKIKEVTIPATKELIVENMRFFSGNIRLQLKNRFYGRLGNTTDVRLEYLKKMDTMFEVINESAAIKVLPAEGQFAIFIENVFKSFNFTIIQSKLSSQKQLENLLGFFTDVTNQDDVYDGKYQEAFLKPLTSLESMAKNLTAFYQFCKDTELELVTYSKQSRLSKLVNEMGDDVRLHLSIDVVQFLATEKLSSIPFSVMTLWEKGALRAFDFRHLIDLVDDMIPSFEFTCNVSSVSSDKNRLIVSGRRNLMLSDAMNDTKWPSNCKDGIAELSIVAMDKLFLDTDIELPGVHLSLVAPTWQVITEGESVRIINLQTGNNEESGTYFGFYDCSINVNKLMIYATPKQDDYYQGIHDYKNSFRLNNPNKSFLDMLEV